ncbi:alpha/beta hydrolase family protein [Rhizobium mongolense]|uniref:alpha/beta hydrolase family protein n=1 Tax=Rhizobium mongolense TaxID=57676 RepID=UPI003557D00E
MSKSKPVVEAAPPQSPAEALECEAARALPLTSFYDTPADLAESKPGALLREESFAGYTLPEGASALALRILYHSRSAEGREVATSAVVLKPAGPPPHAGWPVIAWAHGTSGWARQCAPSLMKDYFSRKEFFGTMLNAGFAVVATDYRGLGTEGPHQYNGLALASDVVYSVKAARAADPDLGKHWVAAGHSRGGVTAWNVAALQHELEDPYYLGAVSVAGGMQKDHAVAMINAQSDPNEGGGIVTIAFDVKSVFPEFDPAAMLTDAGLKHYADVTTKGCTSYAKACYAGVPPSSLLRPGWADLPEVDRWFAGLVPGEKPIRGPILVITSPGDTAVRSDGIEATVRRICRTHKEVTFRSYPNLDHGQVMAQTVGDQLAWIKDRFDGKPVPNYSG